MFPWLFEELNLRQNGTLHIVYYLHSFESNYDIDTLLYS